MDCRFTRSGGAMMTVLFAGLGIAQTPAARAILDRPESEQVRFVNQAIEAGLPAERAGGMTMLILNRSALVLPLLERRVEAELRSRTPSKEFIGTATEMIAYAGDEQALRAVSRLMSIDEGRFGVLVGRTLDNASSFRNPFTVAYRGCAIGDDALARRIGLWSESALGSARMQRVFREAMAAEYGHAPGDAEWAGDAIASRIGSALRQELKVIDEMSVKPASKP
jgi:hypothetical protein